MTTWTFQDPRWLYTLGALVVIAVMRHWRRVPVFVVPHAMEWSRVLSAPHRRWLAAAVYAGLALLIVALARPQLLEKKQADKQPGYDIMLAIDLSTSMYSEDFSRNGVTMNRLQAIKPIVEAFINQRPNDRLGIVAFAGRAYTFAPLTFDHDWLRKQTGRLAIGLVEDGTAIGDAIGVSLSRLKQGQRSKETKRLGAFIVVLTDGASNRGALDPRQAAGLAAEENVAIYTIGAGAEGKVPMPVFDYQGKRTGTDMIASEIDALVLRDIAEKTGGLFFRATDSKAIQAAFAGIDRATKVEFDPPPFQITHELFPWLAAPAILFLGLALAGAATRSESEAHA